jgi:hypothetical protein
MKDNEHTILDDVIMAYMAACADHSLDILEEWVKRYPEYSSELREFDAYWRLSESVPQSTYTEEEEESLVARASSVIQNIIFHQRKGAGATAPEALSSLIDESESQGMSLEEFAAAAEMSEPMVMVFDRKQVRYETIPRKAIENFARALGKLFDTVNSYLKGEMQLAPAHYRADAAPKAVKKYDFSFIVNIDQMLTDEAKEEWLKLPPYVSEIGGGLGDQAS